MLARITALVLAFTPLPALAEETVLMLEARPITNWKAIYGRIEPRDRLPARARIGGTLAELQVNEGDMVKAGQEIARIIDDKLDFQLGAVDAQIDALTAQLENATADRERGETLLKRGVTTSQAQDALRTQVDVIAGQIAAQQAQKKVIEQQAREGAVTAPVDGIVLSVPQAKGAVVMPGEAVAQIGGGGYYLRLAIPEGKAAALETGAGIRVTTPDGEAEGRLARIYPQVENGRVIADVELGGLATTFTDARVLVRVPVGTRDGLMVPETAIETMSGLDFVTRETDHGPLRQAIVPGMREIIGGTQMVEVVTGLRPGDRIYPTPPPPAAKAASAEITHE